MLCPWGKGTLRGGLLCVAVVACVLWLSCDDEFCLWGWDACSVCGIILSCALLSWTVVCVCVLGVYSL